MQTLSLQTPLSCISPQDPEQKVTLSLHSPIKALPRYPDNQLYRKPLKQKYGNNSKSIRAHQTVQHRPEVERDMQRGQKKSVTGIDHLERNDFIIRKQESKKKHLHEEAKKVMAEKEEAEAEVEAAKTEVADLWKEHDYLTSANRTKVERSNRLDLDIRNKTNCSQALDDAIDAKKQEVAGLSAKADEKLRDFYIIKERGNWQDPMFFAMSAYIYRIDEGLQFCIKAIQDFAYSGFGGRGGKHGDIFWDNESYAIKQYLKMFSDLASATLKQVADWFVWLAGTLGRFNANELRRADHEVHDIADGRYDGRIQKIRQGVSR